MSYRLLLAAVILLQALAAQAKDIGVSSKQIERMEIKIAQTRPATTEAIALMPATVVPAMNAHIAATAPFSGTVVQAHVLPGQYIKKGDPLTTLASRELLETLSQLAQSEAELQGAKAIAERRRTLADKKIYSPTMADEAEAQVAKIQAVINQNRNTVALAGIKRGRKRPLYHRRLQRRARRRSDSNAGRRSAAHGSCRHVRFERTDLGRGPGVGGSRPQDPGRR